ncbi:Os08g0121975, partial [Oryza sativa Japonica Group]
AERTTLEAECESWMGPNLELQILLLQKIWFPPVYHLHLSQMQYEMCSEGYTITDTYRIFCRAS